MNAKLAAVAGLAVAGFTAASSAQVVNMHYLGSGTGRSVNVRYYDSEGDLESSSRVFAGTLRHSISGLGDPYADLNGVVSTFCADFHQSVTRSSSSQYEVVDVSELPRSSRQAPMGDAAAGVLRSAFGLANANALGEGGFTRDFATAFQLFVWEVIEDYDPTVGADSLSLVDGGMRARQRNGNALWSGVVTAFNDIKAAIDGPQLAGILGLASDRYQDQLVVGTGNVVVPAPGAAALAFAGLGLIGARRRRG